ncbi:hypothetical protein [Inquilinus limosus]|uniref:hypothetical protein n=1 Tax=Inquilinus limosus TaxID=171674 RepID=UPI0012DD4894|nr:hypothetical protein [Inquilinus limosus]
MKPLSLSDRLLWERYQFPSPPVKRALPAAIMPQSFRIWKDSLPTTERICSGTEPERAAAIEADEVVMRALFRRDRPRRFPKASGRSRLGAPRRRQEEILRMQAKRFLLPDNNLCTNDA